ncbi:hypothetical protein H6794_02890 [Candidatus Nomurabacteria bacterium]|nr:hypothetical protein [Candidatus Nomurabacteria bacterium]
MEQKDTANSFDLLHRYNKTGRMAAFVLMATLGFANTDKALGFIVWHGEDTSVQYLHNSEKSSKENTWIILPGLGVQSGNAMASVLEPALSRSGKLAYANYSDDGVNISKLASSIEEVFSKTNQSVSFYAHSMGGTVTLKLLAQLNNRVPIDNIVLDCSPYDIKDAKDSTAPIISAVAPIYGGGLISKTIAEVRNNVFIHKNNRLSTAEQFKDAGRIAITGSSPRLFTDQLNELGKITPTNYSQYIPDSTKIYFINPKNTANDQTVDVERAYNSWDAMFGGRVIRISVQGGGHANPTQRPTEYYKAMEPYFVSPYQEPLQARAPMTQ